MLHKVLYTKTCDLYYTKFLSRQQGTLVVPGPEVADLWREELILSKIEMLTLTYADWIKSLLSKTRHVGEDLVSKTDLWDYVHRIWKNLGGPDNFTVFQNVFDLYTDLKSITDDPELFKQILEVETDLPEHVIAGLSNLYSIKEINDEYQIVRKLIDHFYSTSAKDIDNQENNFGAIHLIGFKIFSGLQCELLQTLSKKMEIYLYLPKYLDDMVANFNLNDWPAWLTPDQVINIENHAPLYKNEFSLYQKSDFNLIWPGVKGKKVFILNTEKDLPECNWGQQNYAYQMKTKSSVGLAGSEVVMNLIQEKLISKTCTWQEIANDINFNYKKSLEKKKNYPVLKWLQYTKLWLEEKVEYLSEAAEFTWLDYNVLKSKIQLDAIRLYWQIFSESDDSISVELLGKGLFFYPQKENYLVVNEPIQVNIKNELYSATSSKILKSLGPSISEEWQKWWLEFTVFDCIGRSDQNHLYINNEALQFDLFLKKLLGDYQFEKKTSSALKSEIFYSSREPIYKAQHFKYVSPSALLSYKNCPRQYYAHYVESLSVKEEYQVQVTESKKGEVLHKFIQDLGQDKNMMEQLLLQKELLAIQVAKHYNNHDEKNEAIIAEAVEIIQHFLQFWIMFPVFDKSLSIIFEEEFSVPRMQMKGRIDFSCYNQQTKQLYIFDFKKSTVPSRAEVERFDQWQLLCYLNGWREIHPTWEIKDITLGYLNLSNVADSAIVGNGEKAEDFPLEQDIIENFDQWEQDFQTHWMGFVNKLAKEEKFLPSPRLIKYCDYCALRHSCSKGELHDSV